MALTDAITAIFCTLLLAAGWYFLTQSRTVESLAAFESPRRNKTRRKARRLGALCMIVLGLGWFWLMWEMNRPTPVRARVASAFLLVAIALPTILLTTLVDLYLTMRLRQSNRPPK